MPHCPHLEFGLTDPGRKDRATESVRSALELAWAFCAAMLIVQGPTPLVFQLTLLQRRRPALLGALQRLPVFCRWKSKYGGTQYKRNLLNRRKPKPGPPRVFAPVDPEHKERKMSMFGANLYELLSRMPNYGIGYRVYRDSWKLKG